MNKISLTFQSEVLTLSMKVYHYNYIFEANPLEVPF